MLRVAHDARGFEGAGASVQLFWWIVRVMGQVWRWWHGLVGVTGDLGELKDEGVVSTAACLLLPVGILISSPSSRAANAKRVSCSVVTVPSPGWGAW